MKHITALTWLPTGATHEGDYIANVLVDQTVDNDWLITITTTGFEISRPIAPRWLTVDNVGNQHSVSITFGPISFSIPPFKRLIFPLAIGENLLKVHTDGGATRITLSENRIADAVADNYLLRLPFVPTTLPVATLVTNSRQQTTADYGLFVPFAPTVSNIIFDLVDPNAFATPNGSLTCVQNLGTKTVSLRPVLGSTVNGLYDFNNPLPLYPNQFGFLICNGAGWQFVGELNASFEAMAASNLILNGAMEIDQEHQAALVANVNGYAVDQWTVFKTGSLVASAQQVADAPSGFLTSLKVSVTTAQAVPTAGDVFYIAQPIEGVNWARLGFGAGGASSVSIGFKFKSSKTGIYGVSLSNGAANRSYVSTFNYAVANAWQWVALTVPGDVAGVWAADTSVGAWLRIALMAGVNFQAVSDVWNAGIFLTTAAQVNGADNVANTFQITGVISLPGSRLPPSADVWKCRRSYAVEVSLCQRYFEVDYSNTSVTSFLSTAFGVSYAFTWFFKKEKRIVPSFMLLNGATWTTTPSASIGIGQILFTHGTANFSIQKGANQIVAAANARM